MSAVRQPDLASGTKTITRQKAAPEALRTEPGHWRNRWQVPKKYEQLAREQGALPLGDGTWLGYRRFASQADAEGHAKRFIQYNWEHFQIRYVGTEFFTEY